jgi:hypothetical protein
MRPPLRHRVSPRKRVMNYEYMHREGRYPISVSCGMGCKNSRGLWTPPTVSWAKSHENPTIPSKSWVYASEDMRYARGSAG